jgi:hypothetical protein
MPLAPGRVGLAVGRYPPLVRAPIFVPAHFAGRPDDVALAAVSSWVRAVHSDSRELLRLGPPVLELVQQDQVAERRVVTFGLSWPLPPPDGV